MRAGAVFLGAVQDQTTNFGSYGNGGLYIGLYALFPEELTIAPTAKITAPADGGSVQERGSSPSRRKHPTISASTGCGWR